MQIFIMRHGQAQGYASSDEQRALTAHGQIEVEKMAAYLHCHEITFDVIFQSPYVRALQTADIVATKLAQKDKVKTLTLITPEGDAKGVHDYIDGLLAENTYDNILLVCHMPIVSYLVESLTAGAASPIFQTASIAQIEYNPETSLGELLTLNAPMVSH